MNSSRSVLFLAPSFPPHGGAGVQRSAHFVKYLPEFGWRPLVVTTAESAGPTTDRSLLEDLPADTRIYRVPGFHIEPLRRAARRIGLGKAVTGLNLLLQLPDADRYWARKARRTLSEIIERERPELIYTTSGPYSSHLAGRWVRRRYGIPWLADFRDPWSENLLVPYLPGYRALNRRMERRVLEAADRVVCVSDPWLADLRRNCRDRRDKFLTIPNGYDDQRTRPLPLRPPQGRFTITHAGTFYRNRSPGPVLRAVGRLARERRPAADALRVVFLGKNARSRVPAREPFEIHDYVSHGELQAFLRDSDVLLLILDTSPANAGNYSGKIYEYIASNRPILAIVPPGGVAERLIQETRTGIAVDDDAASIAGAIERLHRQWQAGFPDWNPDQGVIERYTRRKLTARLAGEFDAMVAGSGR